MHQQYYPIRNPVLLVLDGQPWMSHWPPAGSAIRNEEVLYVSKHYENNQDVKWDASNILNIQVVNTVLYSNPS